MVTSDQRGGPVLIAASLSLVLVVPLSKIQLLFDSSTAKTAVGAAVLLFYWAVIFVLNAPDLIRRGSLCSAKLHGGLSVLLLLHLALTGIAIFRARVGEISTTLEFIKQVSWYGTITVYGFSLLKSSVLKARNTLYLLYVSAAVYIILNVGLYFTGFSRDLSVIHNYRSTSTLGALLGVDLYLVWFPLVSALKSVSALAGCVLVAGFLHVWWINVHRVFWLLAVGCSLFVLTAVDARAATIFGITTIAVSLLCRKKYVARITTVAVCVMPFFAGVLLLLASVVSDLGLLERISRASPDNIRTVSKRAYVWSPIIEELAEPRPIHLVGFGLFGSTASGLIDQYSQVFDARLDDPTRKSPHNFALGIILDQGYVGLLVYMGLLLVFLRTFRENDRIDRVIAFPLMLYIVLLGGIMYIPSPNASDLFTFFILLVVFSLPRELGRREQVAERVRVRNGAWGATRERPCVSSRE